MTTLSKAIGRPITVIAAAAIWRREEGNAIVGEQAVLLVAYPDLADVYVVDKATGRYTRAFDRWMADLGLTLVSNLADDLPHAGWQLQSRSGGGYAIMRDGDGRVLAQIAEVPPRWLHLAERQGGLVRILASCAPCGPTAAGPWPDGEHTHLWMDGAVRSGRAWGGTVAVELGRA